MAKQDYYATLGVARDATAEDLKKAYRQLAKKHHPDQNHHDKTAEARFKEISEAYEVLKDDQKRAAYDRFGHAAFEAGMGGANPGGFDFGQGAGLGDIFDQVFGEFMGGRRANARGPRAGGDIRQAVEIDLAQAFSGTKVGLRLATRVSCEACSGTGSEDRDRAATVCGNCGGSGVVRGQHGFFVVQNTCLNCGGTGRVVRHPCRACAGQGTVQRERSLQVSIPAGVEDGTRIRVAGEGEAGGRGAPPGDLYVHVSIRPHPLFQREGAHIFCRVPLRMTQAALGAEVEVPVVDGTRAKVKIPAGAQTGDQFRLRGKGFSVLRSAQRGDMVIQVAVETPQHLSRRQRELLEEFEAEEDGHKRSSPEAEGFFAKVKEFFDAARS
jgi:molecular chaperone DnaJ